MIGDYRTLIKSLNVIKAIAAYNMVILYGAAMLSFAQSTPIPQNSVIRFGIVLRALISTGLPIFAGFYWRTRFGSLIDHQKLGFDHVKDALRFLGVAVLLEFVRLAVMAQSPDYGLTWHALHFIALAMILQVLISLLPKKASWAVMASFVIGSLFLPKVGAFKSWQITDFSTAALSRLAWLWLLTISAVIFWFVFSSTGGVEGSRRKGLRTQILFVSAMGLALFAMAYHEKLLLNTGVLVSFANLPAAIFVPMPGLNFWPFLVFYPLFLSGYFLRWFLFDVRNAKFLVPSLVFTSLSVVALFAANSHWLSDPDLLISDISHDVSSPVVWAAAGLFYLELALAYAALRARAYAGIEKFTELSSNVIGLYVLAPLAYVCFREIAPVRLLSPLQIFVVVHVLYVITLWTSYRMTIVIGRKLRTS